MLLTFRPGGIKRGFEHRLLPPFKVTKSSDSEYAAGTNANESSVADHDSDDLEAGKESPYTRDTVQFIPPIITPEGRELSGISALRTEEGSEDGSDYSDDGLYETNQRGRPTAIIAEHEDREEEGDRERLLPYPWQGGRSATFPRAPYRRSASS